MSFLESDQLEELVRLASLADSRTRDELSGGIISGENDYTSTFVARLRDLIVTHSQSGLTATSIVLPSSVEREMGGDAAIILTSGSQSKIAVFEAKFPRFEEDGYRWDQIQSSSGSSHFSSQLERQRHWRKKLAVFEMFYCESAYQETPTFLEQDGSSCIWYEDAERFMSGRSNPNAPWTQVELKSMLRESRVSLASILKSFGLCQKGMPIEMTDPNELGRAVI